MFSRVRRLASAARDERMAIRRTSRERFAALLAGLVYLGVFSAAWAAFGAVALLPALATLLTLLLLFGFYCIHKIRGDIRDGTLQLQSVLDIRAAVGADVPLPPFGSPMIEADCGNVIVRHILKYRPGLIVEAGSGTSTVLAASCLKQIGAGKVVALENMKPWAELARQNLQSLGLAEYGYVRYAPLERQQCDGREYDWFAAGAQQFDRRSTCCSWTALRPVERRRRSRGSRRSRCWPGISTTRPG